MLCFFKPVIIFYLIHASQIQCSLTKISNPGSVKQGLQRKKEPSAAMLACLWPMTSQGVTPSLSFLGPAVTTGDVIGDDSTPGGLFAYFLFFK